MWFWFAFSWCLLMLCLLAVPHHIHDSQIFSPILCVVFSFTWWEEKKFEIKSFKFWWFPVCLLFLLLLLFLVSQLRNHSQIQSMKMYIYAVFWVLDLALTFRFFYSFWVNLFFLKLIYIYIHMSLFIYLAVSGLSGSTRDLHCSRECGLQQL